MKKTQTSSFGTGKREGHDSSAFYNRSLYESNGAKDRGLTLPAALSEDEMAQIQPAPLGDWVDHIYTGTSEKMAQIPDHSVGLAFTSPPYNVGKDYDDDLDLESYAELIRNVGKEVYRVLRPGGRYVINIANLGRKPYIPLNALFFKLHMDLDFLPMGEIIWQKAKGAGNSTAWGSWMSAKAPRLRDVHEYLLVFAKQSFSRPDQGVDDLGANEFLENTVSIWDIQPESAHKVRHPAPFPVELAERVIALYSFVGDVVLDPFSGSGSTCVAAVMNDRHYVGYDISQEYCEIARERIRNIGRTYLVGARTEATELSVAFGLLNVEKPSKIPFAEVDKWFGGSLSRRKFHGFKTERNNPKNEMLYKQFFEIGQSIQKNYSEFREIRSLSWRGGKKQSAASNLNPQDLMANDVLISIKSQSNLILNTSPYNLFIQMPQGKPKINCGENWFQKTALKEYQSLYEFLRAVGNLTDLPAFVEEFEREATKAQRRDFSQVINQLSPKQQIEFGGRYLQMCHQVAQVSAEKFNDFFEICKKSAFYSAVSEGIAEELFRMRHTAYLFAGTDRKEKFAVRIPGLSEWRQGWILDNIEAEPDLAKGQSVVYLHTTIRNIATNETFKLPFQVQVRWSHGKFGGVPEAKVYKDFRWIEVSFFESLLS